MAASRKLRPDIRRRLWPAGGGFPLRRRLRLVVSGAMVLSMLLLFATVSVLEFRHVRLRNQERAESIAAVLAQNLRAALAFSDRAAAAELLSSVSSVSGILWAVLLDERKKLFAAYAPPPNRLLPSQADLDEGIERTLQQQQDKPAALMDRAGTLWVSEPVRVDREPLGWLVLGLDVEKPAISLFPRLALVLLAAAVAAFVASVGAGRVLESMMRPILSLADVMREISRTHAYALRLVRPQADEIGDLYDGFNVLLEELETRERRLVAQQYRLLRLATRDEVTQLSNRHHFRQLLDEALARADAEPFALVCFDLDRFKNVNDSLGHDVGDRVLRLVGERLRHVARAEDTMARTGGDEFSILLTHIRNEQDALPAARRILDALQEPFQIEGLVLHVGASIGIALAPRDAQEAEQLLKNADLALYEVKAAGRNDLRFYDPQMGSRVDRRLVIERELRDALLRGELQLVYQPQIDTCEQTVTGLEALLRWNHPLFGEISPAEFIPVAEDCGFITALGAWALEEACREVQRFGSELSIAVNLSPVQVLTQDLAALIDDVLARTGLAPQRLELEITESLLLEEDEATLRQLKALRQRGVGIVLDDFGTGYASMAYLLRFEFNKIKIDRSFVAALHEKGRKRAIVRAIIDMSHRMNMKVIAEGVETSAQMQLLAGDGCVKVQGYLYSQPLAPDELLRFLAFWRGPRLAGAAQERKPLLPTAS